ncbi:hypothetical protein BH11PSE8_BH11PSE8_27000 [soil metagenome]
MGEDEFTFWVELPAGAKHVVFEDLPHLIALALWPDEEPHSERRDFSYGGARINLEEELPKAVDAGLLQVRDPLTLGRHTFPIGDALRRSVVLLHDLRKYLAQRGGDIGVRLIAPEGAEQTLIKQDSDFVPIGLVAKDAAMREHSPQPGENDLREDIRNAMRETTEKDFLARLSEYLRQGKLKAINPLNGAPFDPDLPHLDASDPMWSLSPQERETALELLGQLVRTDEAGHRGSVLQSSAANLAVADEQRARQARGFYTLREAAQRLADAHGLNASKLLKQLAAAFQKGDLVVRDSETEAPVHGDHRLRDFYDWVTPRDIDVLLADVWRVSYRFPALSPFSELTGTLHLHADERLFALGDVPEMTARALVPGGSLAQMSNRGEHDTDAAELRLLLAITLQEHKEQFAAAISRGEVRPTWGRLPSSSELVEVLSIAELRKFGKAVRVDVVMLDDQRNAPEHAPASAAVAQASAPTSYLFSLAVEAGKASYSIADAVMATARAVHPTLRWEDVPSSVVIIMTSRTHKTKLLRAIEQREIVPRSPLTGDIPEHAVSSYPDTVSDQWLLPLSEFRIFCSGLLIELVPAVSASKAVMSNAITTAGAPRATWLLGLEALLPDLERHLGRTAKVREVIKHLKANGADYRIERDGGPDQLFWRTGMEDRKLIEKKTISNAVSDWRKNRSPA